MRQTKLYLKSNISESDNQNQISRTDSTTLQVHCKKFQIFICEISKEFCKMIDSESVSSESAQVNVDIDKETCSVTGWRKPTMTLPLAAD